MKKSASGVFLDTIGKVPDIELGEGIPNEKRVRDIVSVSYTHLRAHET